MYFGLEWCVRQMENEIMSIFPTPVVKISLGRSFTKPEMRTISNIPTQRLQGTANHQSKDGYLFDTFASDEGLKDIKKFCEDELKRFLEEVEGVDTDIAGIRITQSWLNKTKPGEHHHTHAHPNSYLSGVLYVSCLPNDHIVFSNRMQGMFNNTEFPIKKTTEWNATSFGQNVTEGDLVLFPSWVSHYVNRNETKNRERISLSFNTFPTGELGKYEHASHVKL